MGIAGSATQAISGSEQWAYDVLGGLGNRNPNAAQVGILTYLAGVEGVPSDNNNPLDISAGSGSLDEWGTIGAANSSVLDAEQGTDNGATTPGVWNSFGAGGDEHVLTYSSYSRGVQATIDFLQHGHPAIVSALTAKNPTRVDIAQSFFADGAWGSPTKSYKGDAAKIAQWATGSTSSPYANPGLTGYAEANGGYGAGVQPATLSPKGMEWLASQGNPGQCNPDHFLITIPGIPHITGSTGILSDCQRKALVGGLVVGLGVAIMAFGIVTIGGGVITTKTSVGRAVLGTANPVKRVVSAIRSRPTPRPASTSTPPPSRTTAPAGSRARARENEAWDAMLAKGQITPEQHAAGRR